MGMGNPTKSERSKKGRRSARPRLTLCFFGFAFSRAANDMAYDVFSSVGSFGPVWGDDMLSLSMMAMFLVCALVARKIAPLYCKRPVVAAAGSCPLLRPCSRTWPRIAERVPWVCRPSPSRLRD